MLKLHVVIASTRPGRVGPVIGKWFHEFAVGHGKFEVELVDLADPQLPLMDEPAHPRLQQYEHQHTRAWSAKVDEADAFVFVTPEYNYSAPPSLINALDYLYKEWNYKPAGFVSYGGISGGIRAVQMIKQMVTTLKWCRWWKRCPSPSSRSTSTTPASSWRTSSIRSPPPTCSTSCSGGPRH
jgi:NAD(P)H-dependent FMN reductase